MAPAIPSTPTPSPTDTKENATPFVDAIPEFSRYIQVNNFRFDPLAETPTIPVGLSYGQIDQAQKAFYIVQFRGPITEDMKTALGSTGAQVLQYVNYNAFIVSADGRTIEKARSLPDVRWAGLFEPAYKLSPRLSSEYDDILANAMSQRSAGPRGSASSQDSYALVDSQGVSDSLPGNTPSLDARVFTPEIGPSAAPGEQSNSRTVDVLITTFDSSWVDEVADSVYGLGGNGIALSYKMWGTVRAVVDRGVLPEIAQLPGVMWIDRQTEAEFFNDIARWVIQSGNTSSFATPIHDRGLWGTGQVVTLADTGIDYDHAAFYDPSHPAPGAGHRKVTDYYIPPGATGDTMDNGINHGSHTAGTIGGDAGTWHVYDGDAAGLNGTIGPHDGQAFDSTIQMQDISVDGEYVGIPPDLHDLYQPALDRDSWIHSNSWGSVGNDYITEAAQTDDFLWDNQEFLVFFAAGNNGAWSGSINPYAAAKNVIAVGATQNGLLMENIADFSSRGPCADGRLKPDVMAPGENVWSVRGTDPSPTYNDYWQLSGTSMATPTAAGAGTLIRQYYMEGFYPTGVKEPSSGFTPSAALVKATLINGAAEMTGNGAYDLGEYRYPNNNQGWGRVLLDDGLYFQGDARGLTIYDNRVGLVTGNVVTYDLAIGDVSMPIEVTLVWTDYPGVPMTSPALVNDLDLTVIDPSGDMYVGNAYHGYNPGESIRNPNSTYADHINNVESVLVITAPEPGLWSVRISAYNIPNGPQPYALVMTGGISTDRGVVGLDKSVYKSSDTAQIRVVDLGLNADPGVIETTLVNVTSTTEIIAEVVVLNETGPATGIFAGQIQLQNSPVPIGGDGLLQTVSGDNITAEYYDSDDGLGGSGPVYDTARVDDVPPIITGVTVTNVRFNRATVLWSTDEASGSLVVYGTSIPPNASVSQPFLTVAHEIDLRYLTENTTYYFFVSSTDLAGNTAVDDNMSAYYSFTTGLRPPAPPSESDWPTFHNNIARVGNSPSTFTPPLELQWVSNVTSDSMLSGPVVSGGMLFTTALDGYLRAYDAFAGTLKWERELGAQSFYTSPVAVSDGIVYGVFDRVSGPAGSTLYAIDQETGEDIWTMPPSASPDLNARFTPAVADGMVFVGAWSGEILALDAATGEFQWSYQTSDLPWGGVAISGGQVIVGTVDMNKVLSLDEFSGALTWSQNLDSMASGAPMIFGGLVYIGTTSGSVYCLDESDGAVVWTSPGQGALWFSTPTTDGASIYLGSDMGVIFALDAFDGSLLWTQTAGFIESSAAYANGYLYVSASDSLLHVLDTSDGSTVASYSIGPYSTSSPAVSEGWVWTEDTYGRVYAFFGVMPVGVRVVPSSQSMQVMPDSIVDYRINVTNVGSSGIDLFDITVSLGSHGWPVDLFWSDGTTPVVDSDSDGLPDTGWLATGENVGMILRVTVPASAGPGQSESAIATFISNNDPSISRSTKVTGNVPPPGVDIGPRSYVAVNAGETATVLLTVKSTGAFNDTIDVTAVSQNGWAITLLKEDGVTPLADTDGDLVPDTGQLPPFGVSKVMVQIQVPLSAREGSVDRTTATAASSLDPNRTDSCIIILELAAPPDPDWPTFHNNNARVGLSPSTFVPPLRQDWVAGPYTGNVRSDPVVSNGVVYSTTMDGYIRAHDAYTGVMLWYRMLGDLYYYTATPTVKEGVVYVPFDTDYGGFVYALDATTGETIWTVGSETGFDFSARISLAVSSGLVIGTSWNGFVYALDAADGSVVWYYSVGGSAYGGVAVSGGTVYVGTYYGNMYALDEVTGTLVWSRPLASDVTSPPMVAQGSVYVTTWDGNVYSLDALTGATVWSVNVGLSLYYSTPAYDGVSLYLGSSSGAILALDMATGSILWVTIGGYYISCSVGYANGYVYTAAGDGNLYTLDATDGSVVDVDSLYAYESTSSVAISDGWVWVQDEAGYLYGFQGVLPVGLRVQPSYQETETVPSSTVDYSLTVTNIGSSGSDTFDATVSEGAGGWTIELFKADGYTPLADTDSDGVPDTGLLAFDQSVQVVVRVTVPSNASAGHIEYSQLTFTSSRDLNISKDAVVATAIPPPGVLLGPNSFQRAIYPGTSFEFDLIAMNTGAITDVFDLTVVSTLGWPVALYEYDGSTPLQDTDSDGVVDTGPVAGLWIFEMVVNITVPLDAVPGSMCTAIITASSSLDPVATGTARLRLELSGPPSTEWPTYQHDNARLGVAPENYSLPLRNVWTYYGPIGDAYGTSPVVSQGIVYYTTSSGYIMAVDAYSGEEKWKTKLAMDYELLGTPAVYDGKVFVTFVTSYPSGRVGAIDAFTGEILWTQTLYSEAQGSTPVASGGVLYVCDSSGVVYAFDTDTGEKVWTRAVTGSIRLGPSLIDGILFFGTGSGEVYALDLDGNTLWATTLSGVIYGAVSGGGGRVFVGNWQYSTWDGTLYSLDSETGAVLWSKPFDDPIYLQSATVQGNLVYATDWYGSVYCLDAFTGATKWNTELYWSTYASLVLNNGTVFASLGDGSITMLNALTGASKGKISVSAIELETPPVIANGYMYVVDYLGLLHALAFADAGIASTVQVDPPSATVTVGGFASFNATGADIYGNPVPLQEYTWEVVNGSGTVLSLTPSGDECLFLAGTTSGESVVRVYGGTVSVEVIIEVVPGSPGRIEISPSEASAVVGSDIQFNATVYDGFGNEMVGEPVEWGTTIGTIDSDGLLHAGTLAGTGTVYATASAISESAEVTVLPGAPSRLAVSPGSVSVVVGGVATLEASCFDSYDNEITGLTYGWTATVGGVTTLTETYAAVLSAGTVAGSGTITVSCAGLSLGVPVEVLPGPLARITIYPANWTVQAGSWILFGAGCFDAYGNPLSGVQLTWSVVGGIGTIDGSGLLTVGTAAGSGIVHVSSGGISADAPITVLPGPLHHISVAPSTVSVTAGGSAALSATCFDQYDNELSGLTLTWSSSIGAVDEVGGGADAIFLAGTAVGSGTITVSQGTVTKTVNVSVVAGPLATLVIAPASLALDSGEEAALEVVAYDAYGNEISGMTFSWSFSPDPTDGASGTVTQSADSSSATFQADKAGKGTIVVTAGGKSAELLVSVEGKASTLSTLGPPIAIGLLLLAVIVLLAMYFFVWRKKMSPPAEKT